MLKNADEAEVKESRTRPKSQADLLSVATVLVHLTVTCAFVVSSDSPPFNSSNPSPSASLSRVIPEGTFRDLDVLTPALEYLVPPFAENSLFLFFISTTPWLDARYDFYGTSR